MPYRRTLEMIVLLSMAASAVGEKQACENLAKLSSAKATITLAELNNTGTFSSALTEDLLSGLPTFCRVAATLKPSLDSNIQTDIWLPTSNWNGKFLAVGSGGWGGSIDYEAMAGALRRGYATSATNDGHNGSGASFIVGHREKFIDFGYRAEHEMTVEAKALINAFYGRTPRYSYWDGCSGGGREGLLQAFRYPDEFDGIIAGDPADIRRNSWALWLAVQTFKDPAARVPPEKYAMIHRAVLDACDHNDGVKDGLIESPDKCHVNFKTIACKDEDGPNCLTSRQLQTAQTLLSPATATTGAIRFPRLEPGTELRWDRLAGGPVPANLFLDEFRYVVYQDPNWDWRTFNLDRDSARAHAVDKDVDELDPHLAAFARHGGKLLLYHGWADQQVAPGASIDFYKSAIDLSGNSSQGSNWIRLFMVPGMAHCSGGEGPDTFDKIKVIEQWVEQGESPTQIIATHQTTGQVDRSRPLCPYPQVARYKGSGSIDEASNFSCTQPH